MNILICDGVPVVLAPKRIHAKLARDSYSKCEVFGNVVIYNSILKEKAKSQSNLLKYWMDSMTRFSDKE